MRDGHEVPPRVLERLFSATLPRRQREVVLGDLAEEFAERAARAGAAAANRWYAGELVRSLGPTLSRMPRHLPEPRAFDDRLAQITWWLCLVATVVAARLAAGLHLS